MAKINVTNSINATQEPVTVAMDKAKSVQEAVNAAMIAIKPYIPENQFPESVLSDIAEAAANAEDAVIAYKDAVSKVGTDTKAAEIALEAAAGKLQLAAEKLNSASTTIGVVAPSVPDGFQETVQAIITQVTNANEAATTAKKAVEVTKHRVSALIEAQNVASSGAALTIAIETATKVDNMLKEVGRAITTLGTNMVQILGDN